jgi:phosphatidate cytidylyltransferase
MLRTRVLTAVVLVPIVVGLAVLGDPWAALAVLMVSLLAGDELTRLLPMAGLPVSRVATLAAIGGVAAGGLGLLNGVLPNAQWPILIGAVLALGLVGILAPDPRAGFLGWVGSLFAIAYAGVLPAFLVVAGGLPEPIGAASTPLEQLGVRPGAGWQLGLLALVWGFDSGAYFIGRRFGRHRLAPVLSPGKTTEGVVGGVVVSAVGGLLACWLIGLEAWHAPLLGLVVGLSGQVGDLAESLVKRAAGVKESGSLFPGHGGMLDRVDSFLFAAPALVAYAGLLLGAAP